MNIQLRDRSHMVSNSNDRPNTATQHWSNRARTADLSVSAMTDADDTVSMVGAPPRRMQHIDKYPWGRAALLFTGVTVEDHEALAENLGAVAAAEVLLLIISRKCSKSTRKWQHAKDLGIPWLNKRWSSLRDLQQNYNDAVATVLDLYRVNEDAAPRTHPLQTCRLPRRAPPVQTCRLPRRASLKGMHPRIRMLPFRAHPIETG